MISRRKEPKGGKPALRVPIKKPVPATKAKKKEDSGSDELLKGAVERGNREQARESRDYEMMSKKKPMAKGGKVMKCGSKAGKATKKMAMGGKMYAKGGSVGKADGCATKGKTKTKMVKMAMGGMTGYKRGGKTC